MIARTWSGTARPEDAPRYVDHLRTSTFPELRGIPGHRGAWVLQRASASGVEFTVITLWDSLDAIRRFAGDDAERAVVPPAAQALLASYDERARHWDVPLASMPDAT